MELTGETTGYNTSNTFGSCITGNSKMPPLSPGSTSAEILIKPVIEVPQQF